MGKLADVVRKNSPYLKFSDNETVTAIYKGFKLVPSSFDPDKETVRYILEVTVDGEKLTKYWDNGSSSVALAFDEIAEGTPVDITKQVEKSKTGAKDKISYVVVPSGQSKKEESVEPEDGNEAPF